MAGSEERGKSKRSGDPDRSKYATRSGSLLHIFFIRTHSYKIYTSLQRLLLPCCWAFSLFHRNIFTLSNIFSLNYDKNMIYL